MALLAGNALLYAIGVPWFKSVMGLSWAAALAGGLIPFLPGMVIKIAAAVALGRVFLPSFRRTY